MRIMQQAAFVFLLVICAEPANASHEGFVFCENSGSSIGNDCFDNWGTVDADIARQEVARQVANRFGTGCVPARLWPDWLGGCVLDSGDTFDVCKTATGPCYRYKYILGSSQVQVISGPNPSPSGDEIEAMHWIPYPLPGVAILFDEWIQCQGTLPVYSITADPSNSVPVFFDIERLTGGAWNDWYGGYSTCIPNNGSGVQFRAKGLNPDGESVWVYITTSGASCSGGGGGIN